MQLLQYAEKRGYYKNGLLTIPLSELNRKFKKNEIDKKKWFTLKSKEKKGLILLPKEDIELYCNLKNIIW